MVQSAGLKASSIRFRHSGFRIVRPGISVVIEWYRGGDITRNGPTAVGVQAERQRREFDEPHEVRESVICVSLDTANVDWDEF